MDQNVSLNKENQEGNPINPQGIKDTDSNPTTNPKDDNNDIPNNDYNSDSNLKNNDNKDINPIFTQNIPSDLNHEHTSMMIDNGIPLISMGGGQTVGIGRGSRGGVGSKGEDVVRFKGESIYFSH